MLRCVCYHCGFKMLAKNRPMSCPRCGKKSDERVAFDSEMAKNVPTFIEPSPGQRAVIEPGKRGTWAKLKFLLRSIFQTEASWR